MLNLETDITSINRVGAATAKKLKKLGVATARDLLFYFPFRYDDFSKVTPMAELAAGQSANVVGQIEMLQNKRSFRRRMSLTEALITDGTETLKVIWFNQPYLARILKVGDRVSLSGKVEDNYGSLMMSSPVYEKIQTPLAPLYKGGSNAIHTQGLVPNYHLTANLTHKQVRFLIKQVIGLADQVIDWLPPEIKKNAQLVNLGQAVKTIHFPKNNSEIKKARERLAFDELFLIQLQSRLAKRSLGLAMAPAIEFHEPETKDFVDSLPFKLTDAQRKAAWEILCDLEKGRPMSRLLEGDVGSGKTMVAIIAMLNVALNGKQTVFMAPTEILARQHYETVTKLLAGFGVKVGLVTRSQKLANYELRITPLRQGFGGQANYESNANAVFTTQGVGHGGRDKKLELDAVEIAEKADVIIGTHALIQEDVKFNNLALAIIDEQHRFGVEQRKVLMEKTSPLPPPPLSPPLAGGEPLSKGEGVKLTPHFLSMTATPIPRSLALAMYGDLALSVIDQMPKERKKIITRIVPEDKRPAAYEFIREQIRQGRQVFVICPLIDLSDKLGVKSVEEEYKKLAKIVFPEMAMAKLHGRLKPAEKEKIMGEFLAGKIKIIVATSVVEVGVDAPNASVMMIEGADRFGLAQLHQFRGRVGRSIHQSYCFLFTSSNGGQANLIGPASGGAEKTLARLAALVKCNNGFELAKMDLKFRGPGQVYGLEQKGFPELKIASLFDYALIKQARLEAGKLIEIDASLNSWPALKHKLGEWEARVHLE